MKTDFIVRKLAFLLAAVLCWFAGAGCEYEVPISLKPTRQVDAKFLGDWVSKDGKKMKVLKWDSFNYVVSYEGDLFRVFHSDIDETPFVSVQILDAGQPKYSYQTWTLTDDDTLVGRLVSPKVIPFSIVDSDEAQKLLGKNIKDPALFEKESAVFTKDR